MPTDDITLAVSARYARAASTGEQICCPTSYDLAALKRFIPEEVLKVSYGCGTPAGLATVQAGETVLDIGAGGGIDCFEAARLVGPGGKVIGIDMTEAMLDIARRHSATVARNLGHARPVTEFRTGMADAMPVESDTVDLVISNCVINLAPDKRRVFREMFRVVKPGGRFTISDIVADQPVPNYLAHDAQKWGDCLSGALTARDYMDGLCEAGFRGVHQVTFSPWRVIDGIHFFSLTLAGYKLLPHPDESQARFATLQGPFRQAVDEQGEVFTRGVPRSIDAATAQRLRLPPLGPLFLLSDQPTRLDPSDQRFLAVYPEQTPCVWQGHFALLTGPIVQGSDDDHHVYRRGEPLEICSKTLLVLRAAHYARHFAIINRAGEGAGGDAVSCSPGGACC